jgi:hypothetical protein
MPIPVAVYRHTSTLLPDGTVLVAGGESGYGTTTLASLYTPSTDTWRVMTPMLVPRQDHTMTLLPDGTVLLAAGRDDAGTLNSVEIYDAHAGDNGQSRFTAALANDRRIPTATLLPDGTVLLAGGGSDTSQGTIPIAASQVFQPASQTWSPVQLMVTPRVAHIAALLPNGSVLLAGGGGPAGELNSAELWVSSLTAGTIMVSTNLTAASFTITGPTAFSGSGTSATFSNAPPGQYLITFGAVTGYTTPAQQTQTLTVGGTINFIGTYIPSAVLSVKPTSLQFTYQQGFVGSIPAQGITISTGKQPVSFSAAALTNDGAPWLTIKPRSGTTNTTVSVFVATSQAAGTYQGQITITAPGAQNSPQSVSVTLIVTGTSNPIVILVPGIFGSKLADSKEVVWLSDRVLRGNIHHGDLAELEYDVNGNPTTTLSTSAYPAPQSPDYGGLFNIASAPSGINYALDCNWWVIWGFLNRSSCIQGIYIYNSLYNSLVESGYYVVPFPYDWRTDIATLATQLTNTVSTLASTFTNPIAIVAHSMGGLIVGEMLRTQGTQLSAVLGPIVTIGTPFAGSVDTYLYAQGWASPFPTSLITPSEMQTYGSNWTSGYELLPRENFVQINGAVSYKAIYSGTYDSKHFPALSRANNTSNNPLTLAYNFWNGSRTYTTVYPPAYAIIGSGQLTPTGMTEDATGCPIYLQNNGDGTVPLWSATAGTRTWISPSNVRYANGSHTGLPQNVQVQTAIKSILAGQLPTNLQTTPYPSKSGESTCCQNSGGCQGSQ